MFSNKARAVLKFMPKSHHETRKTSKITVIFTVAIAIRKFQRFESNNFKRLLQYNFDKEEALNELSLLYEDNNEFYLLEYVKLAYFIRKFCLTIQEFSTIEKVDLAQSTLVARIYKCLVDGCSAGTDCNQKLLYFLCLSLKHLTRNSDNVLPSVKIDQLAELLRISGDSIIKNELVALLGYCIERSKEVLSIDIGAKLEDLILHLPELSHEVKALFFSKLEANKAVTHHALEMDQESEEARRTMAIRTVKKNQQVVSKTIQTIKSKQEMQNSEEADFKLLNLSDCFKNRGSRLNTKSISENLETIPSPVGSDRSMWRNTWWETIELYSKVSRSEPLRADDKDNYLPDKFLGSHHYYDGLFSSCEALYSFLINRMCASMLAKASHKQQLSEKAVDKLLKCVTGFENLVSVLKLTSEFVDVFVKQIYQAYWDLKKITSPGLITDFIQKLMAKTTKENSGWVWTSVDQKPFVHREVEQQIVEQLNEVRRDAVKAIYNCTSRDKAVMTAARIDKIRACLVMNDGRFNDSKFKSYIFKLIELAESREDFKYAKVFADYISNLQCLEGESTDNIKVMLRFVMNQARDLQRAQELFSDDVVRTLLQLLTDDFGFSNSLKVDVVEIISTYVKHELIVGVSEDNLELLLKETMNSSDSALMDAALTSLLLLADKARPFSPRILRLLVVYFDRLGHDEHYSSYILFILSRAILAEREPPVSCYLSDSWDIEKISSKLQCDHVVCLSDDNLDDVDDQQQVRFQKPSEKNCHSFSDRIAFLTAKIILKSIVNKSSLSEVTVDNLLWTLNGTTDDEKQVRIVASKCLCMSSKYISISSDHLMQMHDFVDSPVYDVSVYIRTAYMKGCVKQAFISDRCLAPIHLESLSSLYVADSLKLDQHDYADEINKNLFRTLLYEARKQSFSDQNIFDLFDGILNLNEKFSAQVLEILAVYSSRYSVPVATVKALENVLRFPGYFEKALLILQNLILGGLTFVTRKTLNIFVDYIYMSFNSRLRYYSFKLLKQLSESQELDDDIFLKIELTKAGYALEHHADATKKQKIIEFIKIQTAKGMQLPVDTKLALEKETRHADILQIFANMSQNKQIIHQDLLKEFIKLFDPADGAAIENNLLLLKIFENAAKNNQTLPGYLLSKLEVALCQKELKDGVLPVFIHLAQKGDKLSEQVIDALLEKLFSETDPVLMQELLSSLGSLIEANQEVIETFLPRINHILAREVKSDNFNVQKLCIVVAGKLLNVAERLDDDLLCKLFEVGTSVDGNKVVKSEIFLLFEFMNKNFNPLIRGKSYMVKLRLANLSCRSSIDILRQLSDFVELEDGLLEQNYMQLKEIIDNDSWELQQKAVKILLRAKNKTQMTDDLIDSIASMYESTSSVEVGNCCLQILNETAEAGKKLCGRAQEIWCEKMKRVQNINSFVERQVYQEIKQDLHLDDQAIADVLKLIGTSGKLDDVVCLADFVKLVTLRNTDCYKMPSFVLLIEQCLLRKRAVEAALPCYCRVVKEKKCCRAEDCLHAVGEYLAEVVQSGAVVLVELVSLFFETVYCAEKVVQLPVNIVQLLENNLDSDNEVIRGYAFRALRRISTDTSSRYAKSDKFSKWCDNVLDSLCDCLPVTIEKERERLDILEIMASVRCLDVDVFKKVARDKWKRELLVSSMFDSFNVHQSDQVQFYAAWLLVEENFKYHKSCMILSMLQMCTFDSFSQLVEIISVMPEIAFDNIIQMLSIYGPTPYASFKQGWFLERMKATVPDLDDNKTSFLEKLADKLCSECDVGFMDRILRCIKSVDNLKVFVALIDFCCKEKITLDDVIFENVQLNDLRVTIEAKCLCNRVRCQPESEEEKRRLLNIIQTLLHGGWHFNQLCEVILSFRLQKFQNLTDILSTIYRYNLSSSSSLQKCKQMLKETETYTELIRKLNKFVIENNFQLVGKENDLKELLAELKRSNSLNQALVDFINSGSLDIKTKIFLEQSDKLDWNEKQILSWARDMKEKKQKFSDYEGIAVVMRANFLITGQGHTLTDTQILCSLIALRADDNLKGKLLEVATGEGKSTIVCILAIINCLRGKQVDIITSSPVLAERDAKQKAKLYRWFNLTCCDNNDKTIYLKGAKDCYKADVVYGEMSQFQFDMLRDHYSKLGTLGGRRCTVAIVDEVDSMLIDDSSKIARLSSSVAGMDHFRALYVIIWQRVVSIQEKFVRLNEKMYFIDGKLGFESGKITLEIVDAISKDVVKIPDLECYLRTTDDISRIGEVVDMDLETYLIRSLEKYLDNQIKQSKVYIPGNFAEFVERQKSKWIVNAVEALNYQENVHYVVQDGQIKPVDYYSTGIVQSSTNWSDGLHQFLQLKHNLKMTSETLTTNFLSNIGFINKYECVYGLTGTLGSKTARNVLNRVYKVELVNIPQRRQKQYLELESIVVNGEANWLKEIASNVKLEVEKERGILIICETIEHANRIGDMLKKKLRSSAVKMYTMNDMDQEKNVEVVSPGEVIIATNLAGRGTDIQTDKIELTGGLHVIVTFLPSNQRVEDQAFGRTARQGKRGTGLMILNSHNLSGFVNATTKEAMKIRRDELESGQLNEFEATELKLIQVKDKLFNTFCSFLNDEIRCTIRKEHYGYAKQIAACFTDVLPTVYESHVLAAVEEQWALFLRRVDDGAMKLEEAEARCQSLIEELRVDFKSGKVVKNPYYYTCIAFDIIVNKWSVTNSSKARKALEYFKKAIRLDEEQLSMGKAKNMSTNVEDTGVTTGQSKKLVDETETGGVGAAHFGVGWCLLLLKEANYKEEALKSFKTAMECLSNEMSVLNATQILLQEKQFGFVNSDLYQQLNVKATILGSYLNAVLGCTDAIKRSLRVVDVVVTDKAKGKGGIMETTKHFNELERDKKNKAAIKCEKLDLKNKDVMLTFNYLTSREDQGIPGTDGTIDQAVITLRNAFDKSKKSKGCALDSSSYSSVRIKLRKVELDRIIALFSPDEEYKDLTLESALMKLKEKQTYKNKLFGCCSTCVNVKMCSSSADGKSITKEYRDKQINEAIEIIKAVGVVKTVEDTDAALRFDIVFIQMNENEINKFFMSSKKQSVKLNVDLNHLDRETAKDKLSSVKAKSVDIEFVAHKSGLLNLIKNNKQLLCGKLCGIAPNSYETVEREKLLERVDALKTDDTPCHIWFENITADQANYVVENCREDVVFGVSFNDINDFYQSGFGSGQVNFYFDGLNCETAEMVMKVLRHENFEFCLEFKNLKEDQVKFVLENARLDQEEIQIRKVKNLSDSYMTGTTPIQELAEFAAKGIEYIIEINEKQFVPWRSVAAVAILGTCQVIAGGVLMVTGFGTSVGMGFVTEGLADIFTAYRAYSSRQFHWSDYCKQKAVSLVISAVSAGYAKCKEGLQNTAKGIETLTTGASKEVLEQAGTKVISDTKTIGQTLIQTSKNLKSLTVKYIGVKAGEAVVRESLNSGIQYLTNFTFDQMKPKMCESIQNTVKSSFSNAELTSLLRKMHAIDLVTASDQLKFRVDQIVADAINPRHEFVGRQWNSIGLPLLKGVLSDSKRYGSNASMMIRILGTLNGVYQIRVLTDHVVSTLVAKLKLVDRNSMTISLMLHRSQKLKKGTALRIAGKLKQLKIFNEVDTFDAVTSDLSDNCADVKSRIEDFCRNWKRNKKGVLEELNDDRNVTVEEADIEKSMAFIGAFCEKFSTIEFDSFSVIIKSVSDQITEQLIRILDSQLIQPWSTLAVSSLTASLSKRLQHSYLVNREQNSDDHEKDQKKYDELTKKKDLTKKEQAFVDSYGKYRTIEEQINYNAREHCIAYSQCEVVYHASKDSSNCTSYSSNEQVKEAADGVRNGEPANLGVLMAMAKQNGVNLKVVSDKNYTKTQEDIDSGTEVVYVESGENGQIGHAYYMNNEGQFVEAAGTGNDCIFAAMSEILESRSIHKSATELRKETADHMESNSQNYTRVLAAEKWIRSRHPNKANVLLFAAGLYVNDKGEVKLEPGDVDKLIKAAKKNKTGHFRTQFAVT